MQGVDPRWNGKSEPNCSAATVTLDRVVGVGLLMGAATAFAQYHNQIGAEVTAPFAAVGALYELAGLYGSHRYAECQMTRTQWLYSNAIKPMAPAETPVLTAAPVAAPATPGSTAERPWASGVAAGEQTIALQLYATGNQAFVRNDYAPALTSYRQAITHWDHPAIRFNMAVCLLALEQLAEARDNLERSLAYGADALGRAAYVQALIRPMIDPRPVP